jgi:hypothetical protein
LLWETGVEPMEGELLHYIYYYTNTSGAAMGFHLGLLICLILYIPEGLNSSK